MPTYTYEILDDDGSPTEVFVEVVHSIFDDARTELVHEETGQTVKVRRVIMGACGVIFKGDGWTINHGNRGYTGKFANKLRPRGTEVDGPNNTAEANMQFQKWIDSGGLDGIKPTMNFKDKPQTAEQQVDPKYNPHK